MGVNSPIQALTFRNEFVRSSNLLKTKEGVSILANHKSAKKRAKQNEVRRLRNRSIKTRIRGMVKTTRSASAGDDPSQAPEQLKLTQSAIDKAAKKGVYHPRKAARKISRLTRRVSAAQS